MVAVRLGDLCSRNRNRRRVTLLLTSCESRPTHPASPLHEESVPPVRRKVRTELTVSRRGFVTLSYGQRRPFQPGTPIQLAPGQQLKGIDFPLPCGSVIGGHVLDENGDPVVGAMVRVLRFQYLDGVRSLNPIATDLTDDEGAFRLWGLNPGRYDVEARMRVAGGFVDAPAVTAALGPLVAGTGTFDRSDAARALAPTYFPGALSPMQAQVIALGLSEEMLGVDFSLQLIQVARVSERVANPDGHPTASGNVTLKPDAGPNGFGVSYAGSIRTARTNFEAFRQAAITSFLSIPARMVNGSRLPRGASCECDAPHDWRWRDEDAELRDFESVIVRNRMVGSTAHAGGVSRGAGSLACAGRDTPFDGSAAGLRRDSASGRSERAGTRCARRLPRTACA